MPNLFILLQRLVPHHGLSRLVGMLANAETSWLKNACIRIFIKIYKVDMTEAARQSPADFRHFNDFFTRELVPDARSIKGEISCPADGKVSALGRIDANQIFQAKGMSYSLEKLMASRDTRDFIDGSFITIYLAPSNYHRVHFPISGDLTDASYIPGKLFSVNGVTAKHVPDLFAVNERLVCQMDTPAGPAVVIMVGAMIVAGIKSVWRDSPYLPNQFDREHFDNPKHYEKGEELGQFHLGSTAIVLLPGNVEWTVSPGDTVRFGQAIA